jgi:hypothetical protein
VELSRFTHAPDTTGQPLIIFNKSTRRRLITAAGLCNVRLLLNRDTGHGVVIAIWRNPHAAHTFWLPSSYRMGATFTSIEYYTLTHWKPANHTLPSIPIPVSRKTAEDQRKNSGKIGEPDSARISHAGAADAVRDHPARRDACRDVINYVLH